MSECIIVYRNTQNGAIGYVGDGETMSVFLNTEDAERTAHTVPILHFFPYQIVELNELPPRVDGGRG